MFPAGEPEGAVFGVAAVAEEGVAAVGDGLEDFAFGEETEGRARGVVGGEEAWGFGGDWMVGMRGGVGEFDAAEGFEVVFGDWACAEDAEGGFGVTGDDFDDGGFEACVAGAAVDDERDAAVEFFEDGGGGGGADAAEAVGAGGGERAFEAGDDALKDRVIADADGDGGEAGGDGVGDGGVFGEDERERAWPEVFDEEGDGGCDVVGDDGDFGESVFVGEVDDERVEGGAVFGGEDFGDGVWVESIGGEAVDGFGGEGDGFASGEEFDGSVDGILKKIGTIGGCDFGLHESTGVFPGL